MERIRTLQVLRAIAAVSVIGLHVVNAWEGLAQRATPTWVHIGAYGVDLFFVISGYIVWNTAQRARTATDFLKRRFIRVAPLYYILSFPSLVAAWFTGKPLLPALATTVLFWPFWGGEPTTPLLLVGWTLSFEALFYVSLSLVVRQKTRAAVALGVAYAVAFALNAAGVGGAVRFLGSPLLLEFMLGAAIAKTPIGEHPRAGLAAILVACLLLVFWGAHGIGATISGSHVFDLPVTLMRATMAGPSAVLLVWGALQLEPWGKGRITAVCGYLGDASYSLYLAHPPAVLAAYMLWRNLHAPLAGFAFFGLASGLSAGVLAYEIVEKPILADLMKLVRRPASAAAAWG
jgi:exopolysaccharide production protein ExoZ